MNLRCALVCIGALAFLSSAATHAEPYFAVREGLKCVSCHVSTSGGGLRNAFGATWGQTALPERRIETPGLEIWTGAVNRYVLLGANLRDGYTYTDVPHTQAQSAFAVEELRAYLGLALVPDRVLLYVDQRVAPGASTNLEAYARYTTADQRWSIRAGQMYLPYGWRLEDDSAFIRQVTGVNFATPDNGIEVGFETAQWSAQLAVMNGTAGGPETDKGKQMSLRAEHIRPGWRFGASFNFNDADAGDRQMQGLFAGLRTGPIAWLAEADYIDDDSFPTGTRHLWAGLLEANWAFRKGHNLKLTAEYFDPDEDVDEDEQNRFSLVWEYVPIQFFQLRAGARIYDGIPQNDLQNRQTYFLGVNAFF
ncbi:MAG TPA: porin [Steroidobacter sp.]|nr:porin [Steroidobacter sp.]